MYTTNLCVVIASPPRRIDEAISKVYTNKIIQCELIIHGKCYYIYIITNKNNNVLYTGVTNNLTRRIYEHKEKLLKDFSSKYNLNKLVYYEYTTDAVEAIKEKNK